MFLSRITDCEDLDYLCENLKRKISIINNDLKDVGDFQMEYTARIIACLYDFNNQIDKINDDFK